MPALAYRSTIPRPDDPSILDAIAQAIADGEPMATAAYSAGIAERTANDWIAQGLAEIEAQPVGTPIEKLGSHARFALTVKEAEARFVRENLSIVRAARAPDAKGWIPAMTILERRRPQDFGRRDGASQVNIGTINVVNVSTDTLEAAQHVLAALAQRGGLPQLTEGAGDNVIDATTTDPTP